jgi:hypothetical protein
MVTVGDGQEGCPRRGGLPDLRAAAGDDAARRAGLQFIQSRLGGGHLSFCQIVIRLCGV